ncbi:MAG: hypothetical protein LC808_07750 [Actinobacteria bacterium]|nr:hypothetical protein [Actinomycetota bacterium]
MTNGSRVRKGTGLQHREQLWNARPDARRRLTPLGDARRLRHGRAALVRYAQAEVVIAEARVFLEEHRPR